ncbi:hypothetical protein ITJ57_18670 [Plantibacter sp. VKM Ac-2880]|uniref:hypothetical protein n=1 Tax=Plantibacter sp. VKM Ac-2880 TaxID=2783827 RepID=UPI00188E1DA5|nr:hypothetical protein [Plantibacter sp. VKM Ac-2880]MBF4570797.1 hypothetical protein [Plantibacter sp. VKM Ac-2880]
MTHPNPEPESTQPAIDDDFLAFASGSGRVLQARERTELHAVELYQHPFDEDARSRFLSWLESEQYASAAATFPRLVESSWGTTKEGTR